MEKIAVIGGLGTLSGGDLFFKLLKNQRVLKNQLDYHLIFEQQPYSQINLPLYQEEDIKSRKFYTYAVCKNFEQKGVTKVLLPCFASHSFLQELQKEIAVPIVNIFDALIQHLHATVEKGSRIGILASDYVKQSPMLSSYFKGYELVFPDRQDLLMEAIYGDGGIKNGNFEGLPLEYTAQACTELIDKGCAVILPCITEISLIADQLRQRGISLIDTNQVYADYALDNGTPAPEKKFKLGILGGVGPSATVDFMNKVIQNTPASKDQDHIKMVVEQNPQIPDRTANLIRQETDPTVAMFSTCKKLEAEGAHAIAIPCNTAHAYVKSIQEHLSIPIINMLSTTAIHIAVHFGTEAVVGLLATSGTIQSRVYHEVLTASGLDVLTPDEQHQDLVMESIYGEQGVKAGFTQGRSKECILKAIEYLKDNGAQVIVLGCTELPLLFPEQTEITVKESVIPLVDPTVILAKKIVLLAKEFAQGNAVIN